MTDETKGREIMLEVDRLYHLDETSEGRINCISDYVMRWRGDEMSTYDARLLPGVMQMWHDGFGCNSCTRDTKDPIEGHDGMCPVPALFASQAELASARQRIAELEEALERVRQDVNWMLNNQRFLSPDVFNYIDAVLKGDAE